MAASAPESPQIAPQVEIEHEPALDDDYPQSIEETQIEARPAINAFVQQNFYESAKAGKLKLMRFALERDGAALNAGNPDDGGWTALHYAAFASQAGAVRFLLAMPDIERCHTDVNGQT